MGPKTGSNVPTRAAKAAGSMRAPKENKANPAPKFNAPKAASQARSLHDTMKFEANNPEMHIATNTANVLAGTMRMLR